MKRVDFVTEMLMDRFGLIGELRQGYKDIESDLFWQYRFEQRFTYMTVTVN